MHTFIYDKYGYLVEDEFAKEFIYKDWKFRLEANKKSEKELEELNLFGPDKNHIADYRYW